MRWLYLYFLFISLLIVSFVSFNGTKLMIKFLTMTNKNDKILAPIKGRVIQFIEYQKLEKKIFFEKLDVASSNFRGIALYSEISADVIAKILSLYPDCNAEWLLLGNGDMLKNEIKKETASANNTDLVDVLKSQIKDKEEKETLYKDKITNLEKTIKELKSKLQKTIAKQENDIINLQGEDLSAMKSPNLPPNDPLQPSRGV